jgi:hypothetical protein
MNTKGILKSLQILGLLALTISTLSLEGCAQARRGNGAGAREEIWGAQPLCSNLGAGTNLGCFEVQAYIQSNQAVVSVTDLGFDPGQTPYRVLARASGESQFHVLLENVSAPVGGTFTVKPTAGRYIEEYEEWIVELQTAIDANGYASAQAQAGQGTIVARDQIHWAELNY